jgi:hypothetical protein
MHCMALQCTLAVICGFSGQFFFLLRVCGSLEKKSKKEVLEVRCMYTTLVAVQTMLIRTACMLTTACMVHRGGSKGGGDLGVRIPPQAGQYYIGRWSKKMIQNPS